MEAPGPPNNTIFCLYCRATIYFPGLPANRYTNHLFAEHNIMYEVQSVINRTLALQLPKEYPELADGSMSLPDSSNRLNSPAPSSVGGPSPAPALPSQGGVVTSPATSHGAESNSFGLLSRSNVYLTESSTQTDDVIICSGGCQTPKQGDADSVVKVEERKKGKEVGDDRLKAEVKKMLEKAGKNKKLGVSCDICKVRYKKISKLKFHIFKQHSKEILGRLRCKVETEPKKEVHQHQVPERKSSRIELRKEEVKGELKQELKPNQSSLQDIPDTLIVPKDEEWTEGCSFFCMLCSSSFTSFGVYKHHIGNFHGMLIEEYRAKFGKHGEIIKKINCKLCGSEVVHKNSAIKGHLKTIHNLTLVDYRNRFIESSEADVDDEMEIDDKEPDEEEEDDEDEDEEVVEGEPEHEEVIEGDKKEVEEQRQEEGELRRWYEGCNYVCIPCNKNYDIYFSYHGHIKKIHNLSMEQYHAEYGTEGETNRYYRCKLCGTNVVWRMFNIRKHLESQHGMSLDAYGEEYEPSDVNRKQRQNDSEVSAEVQEVSSLDYEGIRPWYEGCHYKCQVESCEQEFYDLEIYHSHISSSHNLSVQDYHNKFGTKGEVFEQYECQICCAKIAHKYSNIASHLTLIHDLSIQEYEDSYMKTQVSSSGDENIDDEMREPEEYQHQQPQIFIDEEEEVEEDEEGNYEFTEEDIIIEETGELEQCAEEHKEPVSEGSEHAWYHGSDLTCKICFKNFANDQWYFHHFSKIHGITKEQYNEQYGKDGEIYHQYQCLICNSQIRWKYSSIRQHLKQVHGTNIQEYESKYMGGGQSDQAANIDPITALKEQARNPCHEVSPVKSPPARTTAAALPPPPPLKASPAALLAGRVSLPSSSQPVFSPAISSKVTLTFGNRPESQWYHGSDLTCLACNKSFVDFTYYCTHIRTVHQMSKEQYNEKYGTAAEAFRLYRCLVCGISVKWTYQSICGHIKSHELTIKEYESKYNVLENQNTDSGKISELTMNARTPSSPEDPSPKKLRLEEVPPSLHTLQNFFGHSQQFDINAMLVPNLQKSKPDRISADISSPTGKWYNQCKFTCKACPEEKYFTVPQALRMHLNGIHSLTRKEYESRYGNAETVTRYWTCLICNKELKCQKGIIIQHLLNVHTMELVDYERQYMDAGDQVVARENRKPRKNARVPLPPPSLVAAAGSPKPDSDDSFADSPDLSSFLLQRMQVGEGAESVTLDGPVVTEEIGEPVEPDPQVSRTVDESVTSMSTLEVEGMDYVPWYFGCRYSCQICNKYWHYPQACRYHLDSVHRLSRAVYEAEYGSCEVETRIFHCSLCQRSMKCERDIIKYHLEAKHSMSLEDYQVQVPSPVVTIGESRRSNAAAHSRTSSMSGSQFIPSDDVTNGAGILKQETPTDPKVPWYRGSSFTCIPCNRPFTAQVSYISHINSKHGMNLREYREQFGSMEEIKQYNCRVPGCTRYVSWTYSGINDHLKSHSLSMSEYEETFVNQGKTSSLHRNKSTENFDKLVELWSIGETRRCKLCESDIVGDLNLFAKHITESHNLSIIQYSALHGSCEKQQQHSCAICEQKISLMPGNMAQHLLVHSTDLKHYYQKYVVKPPPTGLLSKLTANGLSSPLLSSVSVKPGGLLPTPTLKSPGASANLKLPLDKKGGRAEPGKPSDGHKPLVFKVRKNHWANGCKYKCALCPDIQFPEEFVFKKHIQLAHSLTSEEYHNNFGSPAIALQIHVCKVCSKSVKHEYTAILNHLRVKHAMTLTMYTQTYIKPSLVNSAPTSVGDSISVQQQQLQMEQQAVQQLDHDAAQQMEEQLDASNSCQEEPSLTVTKLPNQVSVPEPQLSAAKEDGTQSKPKPDLEDDTEFYTVYT